MTEEVLKELDPAALLEDLGAWPLVGRLSGVAKVVKDPVNARGSGVTDILEALPPAEVLGETDNWAAWERWQVGLTLEPTLCDTLPPLRLLLVMDNLKGQATADFVVWLFEHCMMPLTPHSAGRG